jgi:glucose/mannose-6-phosphate isomerase
VSDMLEMIRSLGDQLRWAVDLEAPEVGQAREFVVAGMGGSGIAGNYLAAVTVASALRAVGHKDYGPLPGWVDRVRPLVIGVSYSGNTEETLSVVDDASERGLQIVAVTTGGQLARMAKAHSWPLIEIPAGVQPRAALGYLFGAVLQVVDKAAATGGFAAHLEEAAKLADDIVSEGSDHWDQASEVASGLEGRSAIVYGGGPISGTAAQRWKTQINENAKMPAWWSVLPELDHNEIVGWETLPELTGQSLGIVSLADRADAPRVSDRLGLTEDLTEYAVPWVGHVESLGESAVARIISLTAFGDVVSWMLAEEAGVDPVAVGTIEKLKKMLVKEEK